MKTLLIVVLFLSACITLGNTNAHGKGPQGTAEGKHGDKCIKTRFYSETDTTPLNESKHTDIERSLCVSKVTPILQGERFTRYSGLSILSWEVIGWDGSILLLKRMPTLNFANLSPTSPSSEDDLRIASFIKSMDEAISKIANKYKRLSAWHESKSNAIFSQGKRVSTAGSLGIWYDINMEMISYGDGTFGSFPNSCHLEIRLYSNADFFKWKDGLDEWGTRIFPKRIGPYILSTHVITKKPMDPDLERDIFKKVEEVATAFLKQR